MTPSSLRRLELHWQAKSGFYIAFYSLSVQWWYSVNNQVTRYIFKQGVTWFISNPHHDHIFKIAPNYNLTLFLKSASTQTLNICTDTNVSPQTQSSYWHITVIYKDVIISIWVFTYSHVFGTIFYCLLCPGQDNRPLPKGGDMLFASRIRGNARPLIIPVQKQRAVTLYHTDTRLSTGTVQFLHNGKPLLFIIKRAAKRCQTLIFAAVFSSEEDVLMHTDLH